MLSSAVQNAASPTLSAWEQWLLNKAKEERINSEKKAEEARHFYSHPYCVCKYRVQLN